MKFLNIEFAPICIPLERRLQTLSITLSFLYMVFGIWLSVPLTYYLVFYTKLWWLCCLYLIWCFLIDTDARSGANRRFEWIRNLISWKYYRNYFPVKLVKSFPGELDPKRNYLCCYFPHGLLAHGANVCFGSNVCGIREYFPHHKAYVHTLPYGFYLPFLRELGFGMGSLPCSKECLDHLMGKPSGGNISCLVVGGAEEAFYVNPGVHKIILKRRKGFVKVALQNGCPLIPIYSFGENELYSQPEFAKRSFITKIQRKLKKLTGIAVVIANGRGFFQYSFGMLPRRRPINIVGKLLQSHFSTN